MRVVSTLSLLVLTLSLAVGQTFADLSESIRSAPEERVLKRIGEATPALRDPEIARALAEAEAAEGPRRKQLVEHVQAMVELRALGEGAPQSTAPLQREAAAIKKSPLYQDSGMDEGSNWLGRALARLRNLRFNLRQPNMPNRPGLFNLGPWLIYVVWGLLAIAGGYLLFLALRHVKWRASLSRRAKALLEEDEPERTLDEWLAQADALAAEGRHREAVRALYLACLLRFDEHRVARFVRGETNWEHLSRIQASDRRPSDLDFRPPTQAFDRVWYGKQVRGMEDVERFRSWYQSITDRLNGRPA